MSVPKRSKQSVKMYMNLATAAAATSTATGALYELRSIMTGIATVQRCALIVEQIRINLLY